MKKLKEYRIKNGFTVEQISNLVGISKTYYWQIENKKRRLYYELAIKIAKVFNLKPDQLFYEEY